MKTEHLWQGILELHDAKTTTAGCKRWSPWSPVRTTRCLLPAFFFRQKSHYPTLTTWALLPPYGARFTLNSCSGSLQLRSFGLNKSKTMTSCFAKPHMYFSTLTQYRDVLPSDAETAPSDKNIWDACSHYQAISPACQVVINWWKHWIFHFIRWVFSFLPLLNF